MGTPFSKIVDTALITIRDYKLDAIYEEDSDLFDEILLGYVIKAIPYFHQCLKSLEYDEDTYEFTDTLDMYEINILADYTVIVWYEANLQDVLEFQETLNDKEFKRYATGQNLKPRQSYLTDLKVRVEQKGQDYQAMHLSSLPFFGGDS